MDVAHERNAVRVAAVGVAALGAERRDLQRAGRREKRERAVLQTGLDHALSGKDLFHCLRRRGGAEIPVVRLDAEQRIAHASAHGVALPPGSLQFFQRASGVLRQSHRGPSLSFFCSIPHAAPRRKSPALTRGKKSGILLIYSFYMRGSAYEKARHPHCSRRSFSARSRHSPPTGKTARKKAARSTFSPTRKR